MVMKWQIMLGVSVVNHHILLYSDILMIKFVPDTLQNLF